MNLPNTTGMETLARKMAYHIVMFGGIRLKKVNLFGLVERFCQELSIPRINAPFY
jgi:hypothetical protein